MRKIAFALLLVVGLIGAAAADEGAPAGEMKRGFADGKYVDQYFGIVYEAPELKEGFGFGLGGPAVLWSGKCAGGVDVELMCAEAPREVTGAKWLEMTKASWEQDKKVRTEMQEGTDPVPWVLFVQESLAGFQRHHGYAFYARGPQVFQVHAQVREKSDTSADALKAALTGLAVDETSDSFLYAHLVAKQSGGDPRAPETLLQAGMAYLQDGPSKNAVRALQALTAAQKGAGDGTFDGDQAWTLVHGIGLAQLTMGQAEESVPTWMKAIELAGKTADPDASACNALYNLACAYSRLGRLDEGFDALAKAFARGGSAQVGQLKSHAQQDPDLANMRADAERWAAAVK